MIRLLSLFLYYFRWQRTMVWTTAFGALLLPLVFFVPASAKLPVVIASAGIVFGFPLSFAGIAFRELISNRRFAMVPELRSFAAAALFLLALVSTLSVYPIAQFSTYAIAQFSIEYASVNILLDSITITLLAYVLISAYLLITQWLIVYSMGLLAFVILPLVVLRLTIDQDLLVDSFVVNPWPVMALITAGWVWLFISMRRPAMHLPVAAPRWAAAMSADPGNPQQWQPDIGRIASGAGTLMRGVRDGLQNRTAAVATGLLLLPLALIATIWLLGAPLNEADGGRPLSGFFLLFSLFGVAAQSSMVYREWPARIRSLWLRRAGSRADVWRYLDRSLLRELALTGLASAAIAAVFVFVFGADPELFVMYVAGCVVLSALTAYYGFKSRAAGWHSVVDAMFLVVIMLVCMANVIVFRESARINFIWLLVVFAVLAIVFRGLGKRALLRIDWIAVRSSRAVRRRATASARAR